MSKGQFPTPILLADFDGPVGIKLDGEVKNTLSGSAVGPGGDMNGDGYADFLIGAPGYNNSAGITYLIYGDPHIREMGSISLGSLNGTIGFKLLGGNMADKSGSAVGLGLDINGDGYPDVAIGAPGYKNITGRSYVLYGGSEVGRAGSIMLEELNGKNGVILSGENPGDQSGWVVSGSPDFNGDNISELMVGAWGFNNYTGRGYVVYGSRYLDPLIALGSLNGITGLRIDGESASDYSSISISSADRFTGGSWPAIAFGSEYSSGSVGFSHVLDVYPEIGQNTSGLIKLASLSGPDGFKIQGVSPGDQTGNAITLIKDMDGDGWEELAITARGYNQNTGRGYVVRGGPGVGADGMIQLADLDGVTGFTLTGGGPGDKIGWDIGSGDFNGDGLGDLVISAPGKNNGAGSIYVVFGSPNIGLSGDIDLDNLDGSNGFILEGEPSSQAGISVEGIGDIDGDTIDDLVIGAQGYNSSAGRSYVFFGDASPKVENNTLTLYSGERIVLNSTYLAATDKNHNDSSLIFFPTDMTHGQFEYLNESGVAIFNFTQQQIFDETVQFVHDGSSLAPSYNITVRSSGIAWTGPEPASIYFLPALPELVNNQLTIEQGQCLYPTSADLLATEDGQVDPSLNFTISDLTHGQFSIGEQSSVFSFLQESVLSSSVMFCHDNSVDPPSYKVAISYDGGMTTPQPCAVTFNSKPIPMLVNNVLFIIQGQCILTSTDNLLATLDGQIDPTLNFSISALTHGQFSDDEQIPVLWFLQQDVLSSSVKFCHDGSINPPSYNVSINYDGGITAPESCAITFDLNPMIETNQFLSYQGKTIILTSDNIRASQDGIESPDLQFIVTDVQHGQFERAIAPGTAIESFSQGEIDSGEIGFVHDNSTTSPEYNLTATDGIAVSPISPSLTMLETKNYLPINQAQTLTLTQTNVAVTSQQLDDSEIIFTVSDVEHGAFKPSTGGDPISSFTQFQINNKDILFAPDGSADAPSCTLIVGDQHSSYGELDCDVDFATPPILERASFEISVPGSVQLTTDNFQATDSRVAAGLLVFSVSNVVNGYFRDDRNLNLLPIASFTQQDVDDGHIYFNATSDNLPAFMVSVSNGRMDCVGCPQAGEVTPIDIDDQSSSKCNWLPYLLLLLAVPASRYVSDKLTKTILHAYENGIDREITNAILDQFWIGCWGVITSRQYAAYVNVVGSSVVDEFKLNNTPLRQQWQRLDVSDKKSVKREIAQAAKDKLIGSSFCGLRFFKSFCASEVTPQQIEDQAEAIVGQAQLKLTRRSSQ